MLDNWMLKEGLIPDDSMENILTSTLLFLSINKETEKISRKPAMFCLAIQILVLSLTFIAKFISSDAILNTIRICTDINWMASVAGILLCAILWIGSNLFDKKMKNKEKLSAASLYDPVVQISLVMFAYISKLIFAM